jgi:hypothetical protein
LEILDIATARRMLESVPTMLEAVSLFWKDQQPRSFPGAPALIEEQGYPDPGIIRIAYDQGTSLVELAADQMIAFHKTMVEPVAVFGPWVCVRAVLEASATAVWLLNPAIDVRERAKRSVAFHFKNLDERAKYLATFSPPSAVQQARARIREHAENARRLGMDVHAKNGQVKWIGMQVPSATQLIEDGFNDKTSYKLLSGMAHGHFWALSQNLQMIDDDGQSTYVRTQKVMKHEFVAYLAARAARAFAKALWCRSHQTGWDTVWLELILEATYDRMRINTQERFWRR